MFIFATEIYRLNNNGWNRKFLTCVNKADIGITNFITRRELIYKTNLHTLVVDRWSC